MIATIKVFGRSTDLAFSKWWRKNFVPYDFRGSFEIQSALMTLKVIGTGCRTGTHSCARPLTYWASAPATTCLR